MNVHDWQLMVVGISGMVGFCYLIVLWEEWRDKKRKQKDYDDWI